MAKPYKPKGGSVVLNLNYSLSKEQSSISDKVIKNFDKGIDTLINAVCGAGKTELVYGVIAHALANKKTVAFAIPRKDVVIELAYRIKDAFPSNSVVAVYGGNTSHLVGDIVVLTTHQLFRYKNFFDLIILDEIDAFPYKGNDLLNTMFFQSLRGHFVMMSATPSKEVLEKFQRDDKDIIELNVRFHRHPLPVPIVKVCVGYTKYIFIVNKLIKYKKESKPCFVFAPTIEKCEEIYTVVSKFVKGGSFVHSKCENRNQIIANFKSGKINYLITTAVLERGVTIKNLQVIVCDADHAVYDEYSLIQISGRVGRKYDAPEGEAIFLANKETKSIKNAIATITEKNKTLQNML